MINHRERNQVNIRASAKCGARQRTVCDAFAINQNQSFLWQNTAQVELDGTITTVADVQVDAAARRLRNKFLEVGGAADAEFLNVLRPVGVHRVWPGLFRGWDV